MSGPAAVAGLVFLILGRRRSSSEVAGSAISRPVETGGRDRNIPRWLDPAIAAARRPDRSSAVARSAAAAMPRTRPPLVFVTPGEDLAGLQYVRYDGVPLLDRPDDVLGRTMQELDGGDEVEVLQRGEIWARVRTPDSLIGWVPSMTLADVSAAAALNGPDPSIAIVVDPPAPEEPIALEALFEAIAAQRMARREPQPAVETAPESPRRGSRKPKAEASPAVNATPQVDAPPAPTRRRRAATATPADES